MIFNTGFVEPLPEKERLKLVEEMRAASKKSDPKYLKYLESLSPKEKAEYERDLDKLFNVEC